MKILHCIHSLNPAIGGPLESVKQFSLVLARRGHEVEVVSLDAPTDPWVQEFPGDRPRARAGSRELRLFAAFCSVAQRAARAAMTPWSSTESGNTTVSASGGRCTKPRRPTSSFRTGCSIRGSTAPIRLSISRNCSTGRGRNTASCATPRRCFLPRKKSGCLARESFALYRCHEVVVNFGTAAPEVDWQRAREEFLNAFPTLRGKNLSPFSRSPPRKERLRGADPRLRCDSEFFACGNEIQLVLAGPCADDNYLQRLKRLTNELGSGGNASAVTSPEC